MPRDGLALLISEAELRAGVARLARQIDRDYAATGLVVVCVLKGAVIFVADLLRALQANVHRIEFVRASSYGSSAESSGEVRISGALDAQHIAGQPVLLVDDIADTGHTCVAMTEHILGMGAASVRYCALLDKPERRQVAAQCDYVGYTIPDCFVVGYGMDFDERYRELPAIYCLPET